MLNAPTVGEGGNPGARNFLKRMDSRLQTSGMTAMKRTCCDVVISLIIAKPLAKSSDTHIAKAVQVSGHTWKPAGAEIPQETAMRETLGSYLNPVPSFFLCFI